MHYVHGVGTHACAWVIAIGGYMPRFIVYFQSYATGDDARVVVEAATPEEAIASTALTHPDEYWMYCYVTTPEEEDANNAWYASTPWDEECIPF